VQLATLFLGGVFAFGQSSSAIQSPQSEPHQGRYMVAIETVGDTQGVDFGPYLQHMLDEVRKNWYALIPETAATKHEKVVTEFSIARDGQLRALRIVFPFLASKGFVLERPAYGSITESNPFPPLPSEFGGQYVSLRISFYYNPDENDLATGSAGSGIEVSISPRELQVPVGGSKAVTATVTGTQEKSVEWSVSGSGCSASACGKVANDLYFAPSVLPSPPIVTLTAVSKADANAKASVTVQITQPSPSH